MGFFAATDDVGARLDVGVRHFCAESPLDAPSSAIEYAIDAIRKSKYDDSIKGDTVSVMFNVTPGNRDISGSLQIINNIQRSVH